MKTYAISLVDLVELTRQDPILFWILTPHVDRDRLVEADRGKVAGIGHVCVLTCPEEQVLALIKVARRKYRRNQLRFYASETGEGSWRRV